MVDSERRYNVEWDLPTRSYITRALTNHLAYNQHNITTHDALHLRHAITYFNDSNLTIIPFTRSDLLLLRDIIQTSIDSRNGWFTWEYLADIPHTIDVILNEHR